MPVPATRARELIDEFGPRLAKNSESIDAFTLRRMETQFRAALADAPVEVRGSLYAFIGTALLRLRDFGKALEAFKNAAHHEPSVATHLNNVAACLIELRRLPEALDQLRAAARIRPFVSHDAVVVLSNEAEIHYMLGDLDAARVALQAAAVQANPRDPADLFTLAMQAAAIGFDDDAVEFFARYLAAAQQTELGETPAVEFIRASPGQLQERLHELPVLANALQRVAARHDTEPPEDAKIDARIRLAPEAWDRVIDLLDAPPEPTEALRRLLHDRRA